MPKNKYLNVVKHKNKYLNNALINDNKISGKMIISIKFSKILQQNEQDLWYTSWK